MERIFDLRKFMISILKKWRFILALTLLFGVLGGFYKMIPGIKQMVDPKEKDIQSQKYAADVQSYEDQQAGLKRTIEELRVDSEKAIEYNERSLLMGIDPYNVFVSEVNVQVDTGYQIAPDVYFQNTDKTSQIVATYQLLLNDSQLYVTMKDIYLNEHTQQHLSELVSIVLNDRASNIMTIHVIGQTKEQAGKMSDAVYQYFLANQSKISELITDHELNKLSSANFVVADADLQVLQRNNFDKVYNINISIKEKQKELDGSTPLLPQKAFSISSVIKFGILGLVGGLALSLIILLIWQELSGKLTDEEDISSRFHSICLGTLSRKRGR